MADLSRKVGEMEYDGLITDINPATLFAGVTIRKLGTAATLKRGTVLARSSGSGGDGKFVVLGTSAGSNETLTPAAILCDDVDVGTSADVNVTVYIAGCFDSGKLIAASGYTITADDFDALRKYGIVVKSAQ